MNISYLVLNLGFTILYSVALFMLGWIVKSEVTKRKNLDYKNKMDVVNSNEKNV